MNKEEKIEDLYEDICDYLIDRNERFVTFDELVDKFKDTSPLYTDMSSFCTLIREVAYNMPNKYKYIYRFYYTNEKNKQCFVLIFSKKTKTELINELNDSMFINYNHKYYDSYQDGLNYLRDVVSYKNLYNTFNINKPFDSGATPLQFLAQLPNDKTNNDVDDINDITNKLLLQYDVENDDDIIQFAEKNNNLNFLVSYYKSKLSKQNDIIKELYNNNNDLIHKLTVKVNPSANTNINTKLNIFILMLAVCVFIWLKYIY